GPPLLTTRSARRPAPTWHRDPRWRPVGPAGPPKGRSRRGGWPGTEPDRRRNCRPEEGPAPSAVGRRGDPAGTAPRKLRPYRPDTPCSPRHTGATSRLPPGGPT